MSNVLEHLKIWWASYLLAPAGLYFMFNVGNGTVIDFLDLFIHEAGHLFFFIFGQFIYVLGGTLMQIILPIFLTIMFFHYKNLLFTQLSIFWLGHNLLNIAVYVGDANKMKLHLIGKVHDWNYLLNQIGIVEYDDYFKYFFIVLAGISFVICVIVPYFMITE